MIHTLSDSCGNINERARYGSSASGNIKYEAKTILLLIAIISITILSNTDSFKDQRIGRIQPFTNSHQMEYILLIGALVERRIVTMLDMNNQG